jgi:lysophospholipase L1-like esterase
LAAATHPERRLGMLAFGDSITNGGGELQWGVALQSWAQWVARGLGLAYTGYAVDGNRAVDVVHQQIPAFLARSAHLDARYELGCLYIGVNDVRALDWDPAAFELEFRRALGFLHGRCDRLLAVTAPLDLGRPPAGAKVSELNQIVEAGGSEAGALILDLRDFHGRNLIMADHVHPTAFGQIAIAERALALLAANGMEVRAHPSQMISYETTWGRRLQSDLTYAYRHAKVSARSLALSALALARGPGRAPIPDPPPRAPATRTQKH